MLNRSVSEAGPRSTTGDDFDISLSHFIRYIEMTAPRDLERSARATPARPLSRGDLRLLVLSLLGQQPRHGYELIQCISEMFVRVYTPSAGSIYPVLSQFEAAGWVSAVEDGGRKRYQLNALGQAELAAQREEVDAALHRVRHSARSIAKANLPPVVRDALREVKQALALHHARWQDDNAAAVAQALREAAAQIRAPGRRPD
ncbi:MAG: PadR family transcriptional regulator [Pseudomonas sp.]